MYSNKVSHPRSSHPVRNICARSDTKGESAITWLDPFLLQWEDSFSLIRLLNVSSVFRSSSKRLVQREETLLSGLRDFVFKAALE
jgi:hypothetical protein